MGDKRSGQWIGDSFLKTIQGGGAVSELITLLPTAEQLDVPRDIVFERVIITMQVRRILVSAVEGFAWMIYKTGVLSGTSTPLEALNPLSQSTFSWSHGSIMQFGGLDVPPFISRGNDGVAQIDGSVHTTEVDIHVKRSIKRANETVVLMIAADITNVLKVNTTFRTYYTYA